MFKKIVAFLFSSLALFGHQAKTDTVDLWYETFGQKENTPLLLIMGGCCSSTMWHTAFCERLADEGFYVIRYDHRDSGLSTSIDFDQAPYGLLDVTKDALAVLDAAGIQKAHIFGVSLGGLIAEVLAADYPERVHTITFFGASPDIRPMNLAFAQLPPEPNATLSSPLERYLTWMKEFLKLTPRTEEDKLEHRLEGWNRLNGDKIPIDEAINREIHTAFLSRFNYPQGIVNHVQLLNNTSSENLVRDVPHRIHLPTIIIHGSEDPIFPPDHGAALHEQIANSEYYLIEGMGHVPNDHFYDLYVELLKKQAMNTDI
jgi:pimeloyl-ACP methyl ester carboxylesterase